MASLVRMTRRTLSVAALALAAAGALGAGQDSPPGRLAPESGPPRVLTLDLKGPISGGTAEYFAAALRRARDERFQAIAISLDTPGGGLDVTREIVQQMLASEIPIVVWAGPAGSRRSRVPRASSRST